MFKKTLLTVALSAGLLGAGAANAYSTAGQLDYTTARYFELNTQTLFWGVNDFINDDDPLDTPVTAKYSDYLVDYANQGEKNINKLDDLHPRAGTGWNLLENFSYSGFDAGSKSGSFTINDWNSSWGSWGKLAVAIKIGSNQDPSWVLIGLEEFSRSGTWSVGGDVAPANTKGKDGDHGNSETGLSHVLFFGKDAQEGRRPPKEVPVPAAAWLMLTGLIGFLGLGRKKA